MNGESSLSPSQGATATQDEPASLESWIDQKTSGPGDVRELVEHLTTLSLPREPWNPGGAVNPLRENLEAQFWFWNRAAGNLADRGHHQAAADVWSAHYLTYLSLQLRYRHRYHKAMPLCNIGFAFSRAGRRRLAAKVWLLGVIEDTLTDVPSAGDGISFQNLRRMGVAPAVLNQLIATVESRFIDQSVVPLFPESVIELWHRPEMSAPSEGCIRSIDILAGLLARDYPALPDPATPWITLATFWGFADWLEGAVDVR